MSARFGNRKMLIPTAILGDEIMRSVKKGKLVTAGQIRTKLARDYGADVTCPLPQAHHTLLARGKR